MKSTTTKNKKRKIQKQWTVWWRSSAHMECLYLSTLIMVLSFQWCIFELKFSIDVLLIWPQLIRRLIWRYWEGGVQLLTDNVPISTTFSFWSQSSSVDVWEKKLNQNTANVWFLHRWFFKFATVIQSSMKKKENIVIRNAKYRIRY